MPVALKEVGSWKTEEGVTFCVWAPFAKKLEVEIISPEKKILPMKRDEWGYWSVSFKSHRKNIQYKYIINGKLLRSDPASRHQPEGVFGPSEVVEKDFDWTDKDYKAVPVSEMIIYELHTGTFTAENNFNGIKNKIPYLKELGINTIELMPVAQFPGNRNWGYDGVYPFAVQNTYGGPNMLKELVNACHAEGIAVIMDVVYNHLGPEGNYLSDFGPYFTNKYSTPWGKALNFDDEYSDHVRNYFYQNAIMWFREYHIDALRLDAVHTIFDASAKPFLKELKIITEEISAKDGKNYQLIAESDLNDVKIINDFDKGGFNHDAQWMDDFHHCVHTLITNENSGYYSDFGEINQLVKCMNNGFVYDGIYSPHRKKTYGNNSAGINKSKFVVCIQNHDQVGNRAMGERLSVLVSLEKLKLAAACMFLSPFVPMLFMGEEYGEENPFLYFISHTNDKLVEAVRKGRKKEFSSFGWNENLPDPQSLETFMKCIPDFDFRKDKKKEDLFRYYRFLIKLKKTHPLLKPGDKSNFEARNEGGLLVIKRKKNKHRLHCYLNFSNKRVKLQETAGKLMVILNSENSELGGEGDDLQVDSPDHIAPHAVLILEQK